jgi:hypothetical protein
MSLLHAAVVHAIHSFCQRRCVCLLLSSLKSSVSCALAPSKMSTSSASSRAATTASTSAASPLAQSPMLAAHSSTRLWTPMTPAHASSSRVETTKQRRHYCYSGERPRPLLLSSLKPRAWGVVARGCNDEVGFGSTHEDPAMRWGPAAWIWPPSLSPSRADLAWTCPDAHGSDWQQRVTSLLVTSLSRFFLVGFGSSPFPW